MKRRKQHIIAITLVTSLLPQMLPATISSTEGEVAVESETVLNTTSAEVTSYETVYYAENTM